MIYSLISIERYTYSEKLPETIIHKSVESPVRQTGGYLRISN